MDNTSVPRLYSHQKKLFTETYPGCTSTKVYGEQIKKIRGKTYRSWSPYRSKLAAAIKKGCTTLPVTPQSHILYLGAATGTTASHLSDIVASGRLYAVEHSAIAAKKLVEVSTTRRNLLPIYADAFHPETYTAIVPAVDVIYQDISQRNQADILLANIDRYLKPHGHAIIMVKARSINVALKPNEAYQQVTKQLTDHNLKVHSMHTLEPYKKDHACIHLSY